MNKKWVILGALLAVPIVYAQRFSFPNIYGGYGGGFFDLGGIYSQYPGFIDFLAFFMIFSGISRLVFSRLFPSDKVGVKTLYVGMGFALAFGGTYYNYLSLAHFGNFAFAFAIIIGGIALYGMLTMVGMNKWLAMLFTVAVLLFAAPIFAGISENAFGANFLPAISSSLMYTIAGVAIIIGLIWGLFHMMKNRDRTRGGNSGKAIARNLNRPESGWRFRAMMGKGVDKTKDLWTKRYGQVYHALENAYISFTQGQWERMEDLRKAIQAWFDSFTKGEEATKLSREQVKNYYWKNEIHGKGTDVFTGAKQSDREWLGFKVDKYGKITTDKKGDIADILKQMYSSSRYQWRRLKVVRKMAKNAGMNGADPIINKLMANFSDFNLYLSKMLGEIRQPIPDPNNVYSYYNSMKSASDDMEKIYSSLRSNIRE